MGILADVVEVGNLLEQRIDILYFDIVEMALFFALENNEELFVQATFIHSFS